MHFVRFQIDPSVPLDTKALKQASFKAFLFASLGALFLLNRHNGAHGARFVVPRAFSCIHCMQVKCIPW